MKTLKITNTGIVVLFPIDVIVNERRMCTNAVHPMSVYLLGTTGEATKTF